MDVRRTWNGTYKEVGEGARSMPMMDPVAWVGEPLWSLDGVGRKGVGGAARGTSLGGPAAPCGSAVPYESTATYKLTARYLEIGLRLLGEL